jgi:hypothetical protein
MALAEHIAGFFTDFAEPAVWSVGPVDVSIIFDDDYIDPLGQFEGTGPAATVMLNEMPTVAQGQTLTRLGMIYTIAEVKPDTTHLTAVCRLRS